MHAHMESNSLQLEGGMCRFSIPARLSRHFYVT